MEVLEKIENALSSIGKDDNTRRLVEYSRKIDQIAGLNKIMAPSLLRDFIEAQDLVNTLLSQAIRADNRAKQSLETAKSIAFLDKAASHLKERNIKDSAEARKQYVDVDPDVLQAAELKAKTEAMVAFLKGKQIVFRQAHDDIKKIAYTEEYQTPYEGM